MTDEERLFHNLSNHAPIDEHVVNNMVAVRDWAKDLGSAILFHVPESRERSLALTNLEQTVMWAIAGIARNQL